ncbi:hypothetical protein [Frigoriglobus tundricola]|uniref:Uncharacterized protein n=1 Tax=Frigoriglobus tundricola TaxID=2774151 RepID=A0A6M5YKT1_9BACT|nr:hypothetical protein [Frigoriglobus tundricola]QJW94184.1 hypothetical protein FTUN_1703 [Frigoriglobus tundricola]
MCTPSQVCSDPRCMVAAAGWCVLSDLIQSVLGRGGGIGPEDLADLRQRVLLVVFRRRQPHEAPENLRGLAAAVARRARRDWFFHPPRRPIPWCEVVAEVADRSFDEADVNLRADLDLLADDARAVLVAVAIKGLTRREVAARLRLTSHEVRMLYREAVTFLARLWCIPGP